MFDLSMYPTPDIGFNMISEIVVDEALKTVAKLKAV